MKYEWKKSEKELYLPKAVPTLITVPKMKYFTISGKGDPNHSQEFQDKIGVLYSMAYAIRMMPKSGFTPDGYFEYTVYPLEGIWSFDEVGQKTTTFNKDNFVYKLMIRQPDFVSEALFRKALENTKVKKPNLLLDEVKFEEIEDGLCVQMLHLGAYDDEPKTFQQMQKFIDDYDYQKRSLEHREIYLSDFTKTSPEKLKTVLRYFVQK